MDNKNKSCGPETELYTEQQCKPYSQPVLIEYGSVQDLTAGADPSGVADGVGGGTHYTL